MARTQMEATATTIQATSQQTRFDIQETASKELDLKGVNISIGKREIVSDTHLKLSTAVHYVLAGRNGVGKSTLLRALGERIIPGIPRTLRILLLQQSDDGVEAKEEVEESVLEHVVRSDYGRTEALRKADGGCYCIVACA
jgi:ATP-binding cassette subfamily F protein 3